MKELQNYYFEYVAGDFDGYETPFYLAAKADAAFAELKRQQHQLIIELNERMAALKRQHAEEIERLKAEHVKAVMRIAVKHFDENESLLKQAERYEKLKPLISGKEYRRIGINYAEPRQIDELVDQLPASGEASVEGKAARCE